MSLAGRLEEIELAELLHFLALNNRTGKVTLSRRNANGLVVVREVAAANSNFVNYATSNAASLPLVDESVRNDPGVYPPPEVKAKLFPDLAAPDDFTRLVNRSWTKFTTGQ